MTETAKETRLRLALEAALEHERHRDLGLEGKCGCAWTDKARTALDPHAPTRLGSPRCESGSVASGGTREYCTCDTCF